MRKSAALVAALGLVAFLAMVVRDVRAEEPLPPRSGRYTVSTSTSFLLPPKGGKLSSSLARLVEAATEVPEGASLSSYDFGAVSPSTESHLRAGLLRIDSMERAQVYIHVGDASSAEDVVGGLEALGGVVERISESGDIVQARVPIGSLEATAGLQGVRAVTTPSYGHLNVGSQLTEGDALLGFDAVRSTYGVSGAGVTIGVISDGILGLGDAIVSGDLPATTLNRDGSGTLVSTSGGVIATSFSAGGDLEAFFGHPGAEGTAMLEIIHDIAPGAQLRFANFETSLEFMAAVDFLAANSDVVVDDFAFFDKPYDQSSDVSTNTADELNRPSNPIRGYYNAVGNHARRHYQETYVSSGTDGAPFVGQPGNLHLFAATTDTIDCISLGPRIANVMLLGPGQTAAIVLTWDDLFGSATNDFDLYVAENSTGALVAAGVDDNPGVTGDPVEIAAFTNNSGASKFYDIFIQNFGNAAAAKTFDMFVVRGGIPCPNGSILVYNTLSSSVPAQSDAGGGVVSAGAIDAADPGIDDAEAFSSRGPTNNGALKPDVAAIDGVAITGAGGFGSPFFGTSAAAPHVAGLAGLMLELAPDLRSGDPAADRDALRNAILNGAVDLGPPGPDNTFGFGRVNGLGAAALVAPRNFTVTNATDADDGICAVDCSLREAITAANANPGMDTISFNIPGAGPHTIQPTSALPTITDPVIIDGYTQPGASPNTNGPGLSLNTVLKIELDGSLAGTSTDGLHITAGNSTVRGLVINRFSSSGVVLFSNGNIIRGSFIGTDVAGASALGNGNGIDISASNNTIGGTAPEAANIISGNNFHGIFMGAGGASGNILQGNFIGTDVTGTVDLGNSVDGVLLGGDGNTLGGDTHDARNIISANGRFGVDIGSTATGNLVQGNFIGTDVTGTAALGNVEGVSIAGGNNIVAKNVVSGNAQIGVHIQGFDIDGGTTGNIVRGNFIGTDATGTTALGNGSHGVFFRIGSVPGFIPVNNTIGGTADGDGNVIAFNGSDGVFLKSDGGMGNAILSNSIFSNFDMGIDLGNDGVTSNDAGDADTGPNNLQNFPEIASAKIDAGGDLVIQYIVDSSPASSTYPLRIELFVADADGEEGQTLLGSAVYATSSAQVLSSVNLGDAAAMGIMVGDRIVATATDADRNTSEFSVSATVTAANHAPTVVSPIADVTVDEDAVNTVIPLSGVFGDVDIATDEDSLALSVSGNTNSGLVVASIAAGQLTLDYVADQNGAADITVRATDLAGTFVEDVFTVTVNAINDTPFATDDAATTDEDTAVNIDVLSNDTDVDIATDGDVIFVAAVSGATNGVATIEADGTVTFTPDLNFHGVGSFQYTLEDSEGAQDTGTVTITVRPDTDEDGVADQIEDAGPNGGDGNSDGIADSAQADVASLPNTIDGQYVTVAITSSLPTTTTPTLSTVTTSAPPAGPPAGVDFPIGMVGFKLLGVTTTTVEIIPASPVVFGTYFKFGPTPDNNTPHWYEFLFDGTTGAEILSDRVVLHFVDGLRGDHDLTVNGEILDPGAVANNAPVAANDSYSVDAGDTLSVSAPGVLANDTDADGNALTAVLVSGPSSGPLSLSPDGSFAYTPDAGFTGTDSFAYRANDGSADSNVATVSINVISVGPPPPPPPPPVADFTVDSTADAVDANPGDGLCDDGAGNCTLRAAIMEANALAGVNTITLTAGTYTLSNSGAGEDAAATGDLDITDDLSISTAGGGTPIIDGGALDRVFHVLAGSTVNISRVTVRNGSSVVGAGILNSGTLTLTNTTVVSNSGGKGGGIANTIEGAPPPGALATLTLTNSTVNGNSAQIGGGIFNDGELNLTNSTIGNNTAVDSGGGIASATGIGGPITLTNSTVSNNTAGIGGGIFNQVPLVLIDSTVSGNSAINVGGGIQNNGSATLINSTISGNTAGGDGGGIANNGTLTLTMGTVSGNTAGGGGGGIHNDGGSVELANTIIANDPSGGDCSGIGFTSLGHNLDSDGTCGLSGTGDISGVDPLLGPLADNGGPTLTHALLPGSPAINAVPVANCTDTDGNPITTDQRGLSRPQGTACDIGAFEMVHFTVNSINDGGDINPGDGVCDDGAGNCTLRGALQEANSLVAPQAIDFNIPGAGPHTIQPLSALPTITDPVIVDGYTQPGASPNTNGPGLGLNTVLKIELDGSLAGTSTSGLLITAGTSIMQGLVINRFKKFGIMLTTAGGNVIEGNFIGTDVSGSVDLGNARIGVGMVPSSDNTIGGTTAEARNVISGNKWGVEIAGPATGNLVLGNFIGTNAAGTSALGNELFGVTLGGGASDNTIGGTTEEARNVISGNGNAGVNLALTSANRVQGNFIGTDLTGTLALGNGNHGVFIQAGFFGAATNNIIGGTNPGAGNVISSNGGSGIFMQNLDLTVTVGNLGNLVQGNFIGTDLAGIRVLGNASHGVWIRRMMSGNTIGGTVAEEGNIIAHNSGDGVVVESSTSTAILSNSVFSNGGLGIDLGADGVTPNDADDGDTGPNNLQNFPVVTSAIDGSTTIEGTLNSTPNIQFRLEFFSNTACDPSGNGEGETFLGFTDVTTNSSGDATFMVTFPTSVAAGHFITATATDPAGNTSEFSACQAVTLQFLAGLDGAQEVPSVGTPATGLGRFTFNAAQTELAFSVAVDLGALSGPVTGAHFHGPAPIGANAGIVRTICANQGDCASAFTGGTATGTWRATDPEALTPGLVDALLAGNLYVNVHTSAHPGGEIRGQLARLICGDVSDDGDVNVFDAIIILQIIVGLIEPTQAQMVLSDLNRDGTTNVFDAILVLQDIVGLAQITDCGQPLP